MPNDVFRAPTGAAPLSPALGTLQVNRFRHHNAAFSGSSLFSMHNPPTKGKGPGGFDHSWIHQLMNPWRCAATDRRRRLTQGPAHRRQKFPVCDQQTLNTYAEAD